MTEITLKPGDEMRLETREDGRMFLIIKTQVRDFKADGAFIRMAVYLGEHEHYLTPLTFKVESV